MTSVTPKRPENSGTISYIDEQYNSERLTNILTTLTDMIGAKVLNIARQDYDPPGRFGHHSDCRRFDDSRRSDPAGTSGQEPCNGTHLPGIPPLKPALPPFGWTSTLPPAAPSPLFLLWITSSAPSIPILSPWTTEVRGFTRDINGQKLFLDHPVTSIQDYIDPATPAPV